MVDRLATALTVPASEADYFDEADEDLDLPMLVQGDRLGATVPVAPRPSLRESRAALIGFGLGLALLVPISFVMGGGLAEYGLFKSDDRGAVIVQSSVIPASSMDDVAAGAARGAPQLTAGLAAEEVKPPVPREPVREAVPSERAVTAAVQAQTGGRVDPAAAAMEQARSSIATGDIGAARALLKDLATDTNPVAMMMLAETFDPNMLAAWSVRTPPADAAQARSLYVRALALGQTQARQRLEALE
jgi:hypothetical protein